MEWFSQSQNMVEDLLYDLNKEHMVIGYGSREHIHTRFHLYKWTLV